jgi:hypothetical protein
MTPLKRIFTILPHNHIERLLCMYASRCCVLYNHGATCIETCAHTYKAKHYQLLKPATFTAVMLSYWLLIQWYCATQSVG